MKLIKKEYLKNDLKFIRYIFYNCMKLKLFRDKTNKETLILKEYEVIDKQVNIYLFLKNFKILYENDSFLLNPLYYCILEDKIIFLYKFYDYNLDSYIKNLISNNLTIDDEIISKLYENFNNLILKLHENNLKLNSINLVDIKIKKVDNELEFYYDYYFTNLLFDFKFENKSIYSKNRLKNFNKVKYYKNNINNDYELWYLFILRISLIYKKFYIIKNDSISINRDFFEIKNSFINHTFNFKKNNKIYLKSDLNQNINELNKECKEFLNKNEKLSNNENFYENNNYIIINNKIYNYESYKNNSKIKSKNLLKLNKFDFVFDYIKNLLLKYNIDYNIFDPLNENLFLKEFDLKEIYFGISKLNKFENIGFYYYSNNEIYLGQFKNNMKNGYGIYLYNNLDIYQGHWKDNLRQNKGLYIYKNKSYYLGFWENDTKNGEGIYYISSKNQKYYCTFNNDLILKINKYDDKEFELNTNYNLNEFYTNPNLLKIFIKLFKQKKVNENVENKTEKKNLNTNYNFEEKIIYKINKINGNIKIVN